MARKQPRKQKRISTINPPVVSTTPKKWYEKAYTKLLIVFAVIGGIVTVIQFMDFFKSDKEKFEEEKTIQGDLKPFQLNAEQQTKTELIKTYFSTDSFVNVGPNVKGVKVGTLDKNGWLIVGFGNYTFTIPKEHFHPTVDVIADNFANCSTTKLEFLYYNGRLYVSTEFKDLLTGETIGVIEYNHWTLYKENLLTFNNDDYHLEVKDKHNYVVFSLKSVIDGIFMAGYFIDPHNILILSNNPNCDTNKRCISKSIPDWKVLAEDEIRLIIPEFTMPKPD